MAYHRSRALDYGRRTFGTRWPVRRVPFVFVIGVVAILMLIPGVHLVNRLRAAAALRRCMEYQMVPGSIVFRSTSGPSGNVREPAFALIEAEPWDSYRSIRHAPSASPGARCSCTAARVAV